MSSGDFSSAARSNESSERAPLKWGGAGLGFVSLVGAVVFILLSDEQDRKETLRFEGSVRALPPAMRIYYGRGAREKRAPPACMLDVDSVTCRNNAPSPAQ